MLLAEQPVFLLRLNEPTNAKVLMNTIAAINQTFGTDRLDENTFLASIRVCATCAWMIFLQTFSETKLILTTIASFACFTSDNISFIYTKLLGGITFSQSAFRYARTGVPKAMVLFNTNQHHTNILPSATLLRELGVTVIVVQMASATVPYRTRFVNKKLLKITVVLKYLWIITQHKCLSTNH